MYVKAAPQPDRPPIAHGHAASRPDYRLYHSFEEVEHLKNAWNELAVRAGDILSSFDYCQLWWKYFGRWRSLEIHTLQQDGQLLAVLPLFRETIRPGGVPLRTVRGLGCDYTITTVGLAIEPAWAQLFMQRVLEGLEEGGPWDMLELAPLRSYAGVIEPMAQVCLDDPRIQTVILGTNDGWDIAWDLPNTYEEFHQQLSRNVRHDTSRRERRIKESHKVEFSVVTRPEDVQPAMDALIQLHQGQWTAKGECGQFGWPAVQQFHRELAQRLMEAGRLVLLTMKVDDEVVVVKYGCRFGCRTHALIAGQSNDRKWNEYSLGRLMHCYQIRHAIEQGSTVFESGHGVFGHKLSMGGKLYGARSFVAIHRGWVSRLRFWLALRAGYAVNVLYSRVWTDMIASRIGLSPKDRHFHKRVWVLAQLFRRVQFRLFGGPKLLQKQSIEQVPDEHLGKLQ